MIRAVLLITGLGAALLFVNAARAQEIANTEFPDGPYTTPFTQPVPTNAAANASSDSQARKMATILGTADDASADALMERRYPSERMMWIGIGVLWVCGAVGVYFVSLAKRLVRERSLAAN
jgi:hypothetical protein